MKKKNHHSLLLIALTFFLSGACTEIYHPEIDAEVEALVVEGLITNEPGPYLVKLTMAKPLPYDSASSDRFAVTGAKVWITDNERRSILLAEKSPGDYMTPNSFSAIVGNDYVLHIRTRAGVTYDSNSEKLLPPQTYDTARALYSYQNYVDKESELQEVAGADVRLDLFSNSDLAEEVHACRFAPTLFFQYWYTYRDRDINGNEIMTYHWNNFGWKTYKMNTTENITPEKDASASPTINNHPVCFIPSKAESFRLTLPPLTITNYLKVDQYTLNHDSYRFYKGANSQLSASGKLFDPINAQLYSNVRCSSDNSNIALGLFEVSSVSRHAFLININNRHKTAEVKSVSYMSTPPNNDFHYKVWDAPGDAPATDSDYIPIPLPSWWYHQ
ncbi:MAG: DUF4249 domain-containing protein [Pedobacter sp.]|nr:DUF4249 domain-containing protein [Pedobacter sp.]